MPELTESPSNNLAENHQDPRAASAPQAPPSRIADLPERAEPPRVAPRPTEAKASTCSCGAAAGTPSLVYALGQIGYDFPSEARLDSIVQKMAAEARVRPERGLGYDSRRLLEYLEKNPWDSASIEWTLSLDGTVLYAIRPRGPFAADGYAELQRFLRERIEEGTERISVPGVVAGQVMLLSGQRVPVIVPELRGMYSWTTAALVDAVVGPPSADEPSADRDSQIEKRQGVRNFLARVYHEVRNLGLTPQDRALNYAATNAFEMGVIYSDAIKERLELDQVTVSPSPIGRPGSDCWDVEVYFFYPERQVQTVRKVYRFTVDVSDNVPVTVGTMRSWFTR
jgi:cyanobactin maturation PatA/PatG family protease